jgi:hypothetical protein
LSFFQHLAKKDGRIEQELKDYNNERKHSERPKKDSPYESPDDRDEVVPSSADSTGGVEGSEGG